MTPEASASVDPIAPAGDTVLDPTILLSLRRLEDSSDPGFVRQLIGIFLHDTPARLGALRAAVGRGDAPAIRQLAHSIKGSSASLGARRIAALCAELQQCGHGGSLDGVEDLLLQVEHAFQEARIRLETDWLSEGLATG